MIGDLNDEEKHRRLTKLLNMDGRMERIQLCFDVAVLKRKV